MLLKCDVTQIYPCNAKCWDFYLLFDFTSAMRSKKKLTDRLTKFLRWFFDFTSAMQSKFQLNLLNSWGVIAIINIEFNWRSHLGAFMQKLSRKCTSKYPKEYTHQISGQSVQRFRNYGANKNCKLTDRLTKFLRWFFYFTSAMRSKNLESQICSVFQLMHMWLPKSRHSILHII